MTQVSVTFQGDNWHAVRIQMYEALGLDYPAQPSTNDRAIFDEQEAEAAKREEKIMAQNMAEPEPTPAPRSHRKRNNASPAPSAPEPAPSVPEPQPPVVAQVPAAPAPQERDLPSLEALKAAVTAAVRAAQKKEGPTTILDLLPDFKAKTKLDFVMNAKDEHRPALADLIESAGVALEPA